VVREHDTFGVLALSLHPSGYSWRFVPVGDSFNDRGRGRCH
jgi:acid phosphatase type 7